MDDEIFIPENRAKLLHKIHKHDGMDICIENAKNDDEIFLCKTLEIDSISERLEYHTTVKQGSILEDLQKLDRILKSMPIR